jgi:hypothetical protein
LLEIKLLEQVLLGSERQLVDLIIPAVPKPHRTKARQNKWPRSQALISTTSIAHQRHAIAVGWLVLDSQVVDSCKMRRRQEECSINDRSLTFDDEREG